MHLRSRIQLVWLLLTRTTFRHWRSKLGHYLLLLGIVAVGVGRLMEYARQAGQHLQISDSLIRRYRGRAIF